VTLQWAVASHQGRVRRNNQDAVFPESAGRSDGRVLVVVADGMGGHAAGDVASRLAVDAVIESDGSVEDRVRAGNAAILAEVERRPELAGMGTTVTLAEIDPDGTARFAHVGDSRAYLLRDDALTQLTTDHTVVAEHVRAGRMTSEEAANHPQRSMLTRAVGLTDDLTVDGFTEHLRAGDRLLLCSDGVNGMLGDGEIREIVDTGSPEEAVWTLVERANEAGGHDNITALVVDVEG
jgi:protein phosphatase